MVLIARPYTVEIPGGGQVVVNASSADEARTNAGMPNATVHAGSYQSTGGSEYAQTEMQQYQAQNPQQQNTSVDDLNAYLDRAWDALNRRDMRDFAEQVRRFDLQFGLNQQEFGEKVRQFNEGLRISQANLTGTYNGQPTFPAMTSYAGQFGTWGVPQAGQQTLAAQNQYFQQGLQGVQTAASLQANPFRQAEVLGQLGPLLAGRGVAGFQAPGQATGQTDFSGLGNMQRLIDDIRGGPGAINSQSTQGVLDAIPTPNKVNSTEFFRSSPLTQNLLLSGMQQKYGLSPEDSMNQIRNTLPAFTAPATFGQVRG